MSTEDMNMRVARDRMWQAIDDYIDAIAKRYPRGSKAEYGQGRGIVSCTIIEQSDMRLRVRSDKSGKVYWIDISRFV